MTDEYFTVKDWGQPPGEAISGKSKYDSRIEVVRARNKDEPELWGVIGEYTVETSARSQASTLRQRHKDMEFSVAYQEPDTKWVIWARRKPRKRVNADE